MARAEKEEKGEEKVTVMILEVDLKCHCCYKKVKKLLCKFPQIRDQVFHEDKNKVKITVVCCNPERIRDKLCCKGGRAIQTIEILDNKPKPQPPPPSKPKESPEMPPKNHLPAEKPKPPSPPPPAVVPVPKPVPPKPDPPPKMDPPPKPGPMPPPVVPKPDPVKMPDPIPAPQPQPQPEPMPYPMDGYPQPFCPPVSVCCQECYEGRGGGPCHYGYGPYGRPVPPPPGPCYDTYGYPDPWNRSYCVTRCGDCFSEDNPQGCSIM